MNAIITLLVILLNVFPCQLQSTSCRTNCSNNGLVDQPCWQEALVYRSSELVERLFSFASLTTYVDTYQRSHSHELNDTMKLIDESLQNHLNNESKDALLNVELFSETKQFLLKFCRNLTSTPVETASDLPPLSCSTRTCAGDVLNYMTLCILASAVAGLILVICIVQFFQSRNRSTMMVTVHQAARVRNSSSSALHSLNS